MRKYIILCGMATLMMLLLCGCQRDYYGKGLPFEMSTSKLPGYSNTTISAMSADNYERFMEASYIQVVDKFGTLRKIKISPNIPRHDWDFSKLDDSDIFKNYIEDDGSKKRVGIDVSEHQGVIDWETASQYIDFAIVRLGYRGYANGNIVTDAYYTTNMNGAISNGIPVGVYFYSQATTYEEGVEEANYVLSLLGDYGLSYPIVLDREDSMQDDARTNNLTAEQHTQAALGFLETIEGAGRSAMIYTNQVYFALYLDLEQLVGYPMWLAQYANEPIWPYEFSIWQYSESGEVPGVSGPVDMNIEMMSPQR